MTEKYLLSMATGQSGEYLAIHLDLEGVKNLISDLEFIKEQLEKDDCSHTHLFTEEWGGYELTSTNLGKRQGEVTQVHGVKIYGWNDEWKVKHGLVKP